MAEQQTDEPIKLYSDHYGNLSLTPITDEPTIESGMNRAINLIDAIDTYAHLLRNRDKVRGIENEDFHLAMDSAIEDLKQVLQIIKNKTC